MLSSTTSQLLSNHGNKGNLRKSSSCYTDYKTSLDAQLLKDYDKCSMSPSSSSSATSANNSVNDVEQNFDCDFSLEFERFNNTYPWQGLDIPENIDKSLENVTSISYTFTLKLF